MSYIEIFLAIIGSNALASGMTYLFTKKKYLSEVSSSELDNVEKAIAIYKGMVEDLGMRVDRLSNTIEELRKENDALVVENKSLKRRISVMDKEINKLKNAQNDHHSQ